MVEPPPPNERSGRTERPPIYAPIDAYICRVGERGMMGFVPVDGRRTDRVHRTGTAQVTGRKQSAVSRQCVSDGAHGGRLFGSMVNSAVGCRLWRLVHCGSTEALLGLVNCCVHGLALGRRPGPDWFHGQGERCMSGRSVGVSSLTQRRQGRSAGRFRTDQNARARLASIFHQAVVDHVVAGVRVGGCGFGSRV